jgi:hypothetical protein
MWHRGDKAKVRDLFDLWAVAEMEPEAIQEALPFMQRHGRTFLDAFAHPTPRQAAEFEDIDVLCARPSLTECIQVVSDAIGPALLRCEENAPANPCRPGSR